MAIPIQEQERDGTTGALRMLLVPSADPTEQVAHDLSEPRKRTRPSSAQWSKAISSEAHLDELRARLSKVGLVDVDDGGAGTGPTDPARESTGAFATLDSVGAFAVRFANQSVRERARDALNDRMLFIPDIRSEGALPLRHALRRNEVPQRGKEWPPEAGIGMAHKAGIRGDNVLAGVLDTGVDADHPVFRKTEIEFRISPQEWLIMAMNRVKFVALIRTATERMSAVSLSAGA